MPAAPHERSEMPKNFDGRTGVMCRLPQEVLPPVANLAESVGNLWKNFGASMPRVPDSPLVLQSATGTRDLRGANYESGDNKFGVLELLELTGTTD